MQTYLVGKPKVVEETQVTERLRRWWAQRSTMLSRAELMGIGWPLPSRFGPETAWTRAAPALVQPPVLTRLVRATTRADTTPTRIEIRRHGLC